MGTLFAADPKLDLVLERDITVRPDRVWHAWTDPEALRQWFCPRPWQVAKCEIDLRPGGVFRTVMRGPQGEEFDGTGCWLEVVPQSRLVWTSALGPGFRPLPSPPEAMPFSAVIEIVPRGSGTRYRATVKHRDVQGCEQHAAMGFHDGWGKALDQLVEAFGGG